MVELERETIDTEVTGDFNPIFFGELCECGHLSATQREWRRVARIELKARELMHRARHPFHERESVSEWLSRLDDSPDWSTFATSGFTANYEEL